MSLLLEAHDSNQSMTNVYNLLREACGLSQAEAAAFIARLLGQALGPALSRDDRRTPCASNHGEAV